MDKPTFSSSLIERSNNPLFIRAVIEDSSIEMDWLWLVAQVNTPAEKFYCYQQALYINPSSEEAQRGIQSLRRQNQRRSRIDRIVNALDFLVVRSSLNRLITSEK
jgi:hypothetical protein